MANGETIVPRHRTCGTMQVHFQLLESHPQFRASLAALEHATTARLSSAATFRIASKVKIAVVVHVVFNTAAENISKQQVDSQIAALNRDYSAQNPDRTKAPGVWSGLVTDVGIEFALASKDPQGNATDGVTRTQTQRQSFGQDDSVKSAAQGGADPWPTDRYLNIWVCTLGGGLLGYAQFPGGPPATDGVVILNTAFGTVGTATAPFNLGRSATHECAHFFNLHHIWGDTEDCSGSDFVDDTPKQQTSNFGKPTFPHVSCTNGPSGDMFMNYMDYVDDDSMVMFTPGQVARIHAALAGPRNTLVTNSQVLTS
jgi:hypothetical protein